ncbi:hypothetical protein ACJJTC_011814 [Scirpophaga incertulas]
MPYGVCAGCNSKIPDRLFLSCCLCKSKYDLECIKYTENRFRLMDKERRASWTCLACNNRLPKTNNQNTPIRYPLDSGAVVGSDDMNKDSERGNVTLRCKTSRLAGNSTVNTIPATIEDISELIDRKLSPSSSIINSIRTLLREDIKVMMALEINKVAEQLKVDFTSTTDFLSAEQVDLQNKLDQSTRQIALLQSNELQLQKELSACNSRLATMEKLSRSKNLEIHGVPESL